MSGTFYSRNKAKILAYEKKRHESLTDAQRENLRSYQALYYALHKKKSPPPIERMQEEEIVTPPPITKVPKKQKEKAKKEPKIKPLRTYKKKEKAIPVRYQYEKGIFTLTFD